MTDEILCYCYTEMLGYECIDYECPKEAETGVVALAVALDGAVTPSIQGQSTPGLWELKQCELTFHSEWGGMAQQPFMFCPL